MKVLLTGANGYIGRRLKHRLLQDSEVSLRVMVRNKDSLNKTISNDIEIVEGSTFDIDSLKKALDGVHTVYYLIHSLASKDYEQKDRISAQNFIETAIECGVKRVIYLGGLGQKDSASTHLRSRIETGEILSSYSDKIQTIWFRAGVIIGSGSASFEIIRNLVQKLPVMITPKWVDTMAQPIGVDDVIEYLYNGINLQYTQNLVVDIGSQQMSYGDMMKNTAKSMGLKRYLIPVSFMTPKISSYWLTLFTPVPYSVASSLIEGLKSEVIVQNDNAKKFFDIKPKTFAQSVDQAIKEIENNQVISRWSDSFGDVWEKDHTKDIANAVFIDRQIRDIKNLDKQKVFESFMCIGGQNGWFGYDWLWSLRGVIDKFIGGYGLNRGRRDSCSVRIGDSIDFWKVADVVENKRLLLFAQMKLPGNAWLEFVIEDDKLIQSAYFYPKGLWGRLYWYLLIPIHWLIFGNMIENIIKKATN
ncbi:SDR family oxidoreductase [Arcobacter sp. FWKO B]|uniref:SDR family oxidoreductase n=1 Tax=Arcobacter sp. FWKO B TaxID=2593672 RepID=UPI0018A5EE17|nr:SDR family oxidoreductase [Arcobacter sp. FWKO B]QOG11447.1 SDR family oxidoreductase [Arcobacter sp. FWKO B]